MNLIRPKVIGRLILIAGLAIAATACKKKSPPPVTVVTPPPVAACDAFLEQFGLGFCQKYKAAANTDPAEVAAGDIVAVDATKEPIAVQ